MEEKKQMTKREKTIAAVTGIIIIGLLSIVIYQYFTIIKVQKKLASYTETQTDASDDGKIVWLNPDVTVSTPDVSIVEADTNADISNGEAVDYVINKNSKKIHSPECESAIKTLDKNKETVNWTEEEYLQALDDGYSPCAVCKAGR